MQKVQQLNPASGGRHGEQQHPVRLPQTAHGADQRLAVRLKGHRPVAVGAVQHGGIRASVPDGIAGVEQGILGIAAGEKQ